jgi:hypothetical protein
VALEMAAKLCLSYAASTITSHPTCHDNMCD